MRTLGAFGQLKAAEERLMEAAKTGSQVVISGSRPDRPTADNTIRAQFVRFLALGGDESAPVHESGIFLRGAYIEGEINLDGTSDVRPLWLQDCVIAGRFCFFDSRTKVISLDGTQVAAIRGDRAAIEGSLLLRNGFVSRGPIRLSGAEIEGTLDCEGGSVNGVTWKWQPLAIDLSTATVHGNVEFCGGFNASGLILLDDAEIGGMFDCSRGSFRAGRSDPDRARWFDGQSWALKCNRLSIRGNLTLRESRCLGEISFEGAEIGGNVDCRHGRFQCMHRDGIHALRLTRAEVKGNVYLSHGFEAIGAVSLNGARVEGDVNCCAGRFSIRAIDENYREGGETRTVSRDALSLVNVSINGALKFAANEHSGLTPAVIEGSLDLKSARVNVLVDTVNSWPRGALVRRRGEPVDAIHLDGFVYARVAGEAPIDADTRKLWLECQAPADLGHDFKPQPFEQLIRVMRSMGHPEQARQIAVARQGYFIRRRLQGWSGGLRGVVRAVGALFWLVFIGYLIGHGYRPFRVVFIMALAALLCGGYYKVAAEQGVFAPRDPQMFLAPGFEKCRPPEGNWTKCDVKGFAEYPAFNPWIFSLESILPLVDLRQNTAWGPIPREVTLDVPWMGPVQLGPEATRYIIVGEILFGWLGSLLAVAAFSGLVKSV